MSSDAAFGAVRVPDRRRPIAILLGHGSGGRLTAELDRADDRARVPQPGARRARRSGGARASAARRLAFTTDSFVVTPDLLSRRRHRRARGQRHRQRPRGGRRAPARAVARVHPRGGPADRRSAARDRVGARARPRAPASRSSPATPRWSGAAAATRCSSTPRASASCPPGVDLGVARASGRATRSCCPGPIGDHGIAIMSQREGLELERRLASDTAPLHELAAALLARVPRRPRHARSDARRPRGDARRDRDAPPSSGIEVDEARDPDPRDACAAPASCSGSIRCSSPTRASSSRSCPAASAERALAALRAHPLGRDAASHRHASPTSTRAGRRAAHARSAASRILDLPFAEPLPADLLSERRRVMARTEARRRGGPHPVDLGGHELRRRHRLDHGRDPAEHRGRRARADPRAPEGAPAQQGARLRDRRGLPGAVPQGGARRARRRSCS